MLSFLRRLSAFIGAWSWVGLGFSFLLAFPPYRGFRIVGLGCFAFAAAYALRQARSEPCKIFLASRPGWRRFWRATEIAMLLLVAGACLATELARLLEIDRAAFHSLASRLVRDRDMRWDLADMARSWHPTLLLYSVALFIAFRLLLAGRWQLGVPLAVLAALVPSFPDVRRGQWVEVSIWKSIGLQGWLAVLGIWTICLGHFLLKRFRPRLLGRLDRPAGALRWMVGAGLGQSFLGSTAIAVLIILTLWSVGSSDMPLMGPILCWAIFQFAATLLALRAPAFFISRPTRRGRGALGGQARIFDEAHLRTIIGAAVASALVTLHDPPSGLPAGLMAARIAFHVLAVSAGFLAMLITWWGARREGESPILACLILGLVTLAPSLLIEGFGTPGPYFLLAIVAGLNAILWWIWDRISRNVPATASKGFRAVWILSMGALSLAVLLAVAWDSCLSAAEVLLHGIRHPGSDIVSISIAAILAVVSLAWTVLYLTRNRESWYARRFRPGLFPRLACLSAILPCLLIGAGEDGISEAYIESPFKGAHCFGYFEEPIASIEATPAPDKLFLDGREIPNPWRMSLAEGRQRLARFLIKAPRSGRIQLDTENFKKAIFVWNERPTYGASSQYYPKVFEIYCRFPGRLGWVGRIAETWPDGKEPSLERLDNCLPSLDAALEDIFSHNTDDASALAECRKQLGKRPLAYLVRSISSRFVRFRRENLEEMLERRRKLVQLLLEEERVEIPPINEFQKYIRFLKSSWPVDSENLHRAFRIHFQREFERDPGPPIEAYIQELSTAYVTGWKTDPTMAEAVVSLKFLVGESRSVLKPRLDLLYDLAWITSRGFRS